MKKPRRGSARKGQGKGRKVAKRTGPSRRTAAERAAIDKRAATASREAKRGRRATSKAERAIAIACPSCRSRPGAPCFDQGGRWMTTPHVARMRASEKPNLKPIGQALASLVAETASNKGKREAAAEAARAAANMAGPRLDPNLITIGKRHRKEFGDLKGLAKSIDDRGGLIQPVAVTSKRVLIAGERRLRAWSMSRFAGQPIPIHVIDVDAIVAAEWDENAERKDFEPSEALALQRTLESVMRKRQATRPASERPARGRKATGELAGRSADKVAKLTGYGRETLRKIEAVVEAAEENPEKFGDLQAEMDRSGKVNTAHKKLTVRKARQAIETAPPPMPMNAKECGTWSIDFPWAAEMDREQASIDAADRAFRPYPEMSIKSVCKFATEQLVPNLPDVVSVWLWVPNYVLVRGYHSHVIAALGFKPDHASTLLTWDKVVLGRGKLLREQTEHAILLRRGQPLVDVFGEDPPTTLIREARRENSRKPDAFYRLAERVTPATRYAAIFSQGGEGALWDGHGDQVGKFAPDAARAAEAELIAEAKEPAPALPAEIEEIGALERVAEGAWRDLPETWIKGLRIAQHIVGKKEIRLTRLGLARLSDLRQAAEGAEAQAATPAPAIVAPVEPTQIDIEQTIAAISIPGDPGEMPAFLRRKRAEGEPHASNT